jgi:hypothetical protein
LYEGDVAHPGQAEILTIDIGANQEEQKGRSGEDYLERDGLSDRFLCSKIPRATIEILLHLDHNGQAIEIPVLHPLSLLILKLMVISIFYERIVCLGPGNHKDSHVMTLIDKQAKKTTANHIYKLYFHVSVLIC